MKVRGLSLCLLALTLASPSLRADAPVDIVSEKLSDSVPIPTFKVDAAWPRLPADTIIGQAPGLAVDEQDTIWVLHRPNSLGGTEAGLDQDPPIARDCCRAAPHVLRFDQDGELLTAWGGPELAPEIDGVNQWPANVHGLFVDADGSVWIGGNGDDDHVVLNFTTDGEFIRQFGRRGRTDGNASPDFLGNPADIADDGDSVLVADGYINKRIMQLSENDLAYIRSFGAYGEAPDDETREGSFDQSQATSTSDGGADPRSRSFGDIVHCVVRGPQQTIYVCDRRNNRVQLFRETPDGIEFVQDIVIAPETGGTRTASDVAFSPDGTYVYIADMMNGKVWILLRESHEILGSFGRNGRYPGQFIWLHSVDVDSKGNVYTTEVNSGRRVQRFIFQGLE
jgi:DNA-binding beta-propeller fold protein YncE